MGDPRRPRHGDPATVTVSGNKRVVDALKADGVNIVYDPLCPPDSIMVIRDPRQIAVTACPHCGSDIADEGPEGGRCLGCGAWVPAQ